jgi:hypothetical protein
MIHGDHLFRICDAISLRRVQWIRQAERDTAMPVNSPVITNIEIRDWRPE